jgi:hypothetical protein
MADWQQADADSQETDGGRVCARQAAAREQQPLKSLTLNTKPQSPKPEPITLYREPEALISKP